MKIVDGIEKTIFDIDSFLMLGQSNMAGRGEIGDVPEIKNDLCFMLRMGRWQRMSEPVNPDRSIFDKNDIHSGISLAASFADEYAKFFEAKTGLIPCADGGTRIAQWLPGEILFDHALMQARLAMRTSNLKGILWHQGESDCNEKDFPLYRERLIRVITTLRKELNKPDLPVILGELSDKIATDWLSSDILPLFNRQLEEIAEELGHCIVVSSAGLTLKPDHLHFDAKACRIFGKRYFDAFITLGDREF